MSLEKPRFRRDLEASPVEAEGQSYVEVCDPNTGGSFRFYDFEYRVALAFDGLAMESVVPWVKMSTGLELQVDQLQAFAARLDEMGFLESEALPPSTPEEPSIEASAVSALEAAAEPAPAELAPIEASMPGGNAGDATAELAPNVMVPEAADALAPNAMVAEAAGALPPDAQNLVPTPHVSTIGGQDSTAFPVLPVSPPRAQAGDAAPSSDVPPSPWMTPRPIMTPVPGTFGPSLIGDRPSSRPRLRRSTILFGALGVLAAVAVLALVLPFLFSPQGPSRPQVRVLVAAPGTVFRYFDGTGVVQAIPGQTLKFPAAGKVIRIVGAGSALAIGDVAAAVEVARPLQSQLARQRERLAFYQQMAEAMHQVGNSKEEELQAAKIEIRSARIAKTLRALADVAVVASAPGEVEETFVREGETVKAGSPAVRLRSAGFRATFELTRRQAVQARKLGFCQVEVDGYVFDCIQSQESSDDTHVSVEAASIPAALVGKAAHLARVRWSGALVVPAGAILHAGNRDEVLLVSPQARVETRPVNVAERDSAEAVVVQGLDTGDTIISEAAPNLRAGTQVTIAP
jgi:multidrug efflux pump subunit AcrA (membrane-fusion protein)